MKLLIIGAREDGGLAGVLDMAIDSGFEIIGLLDDNLDRPRRVLGFEVLGSVESLSKYAGNHFLVSIGENAARRRIFEAALQAGLRPASLINAAASFGARVKVGDGAVIHAGAVIISGTTIGRGVIVNAGATIDHDNRIGDFVNIGPGSHTAGRVWIDDDAFIGTGAVLIPDTHVGRRSVVGAGAVVLHDVPDGCTVVGNPARIIG